MKARDNNYHFQANVQIKRPPYELRHREPILSASFLGPLCIKKTLNSFNQQIILGDAPSFPL